MPFPSAPCSVLSNTERISLVVLRLELPPMTELVLVLDKDFHWFRQQQEQGSVTDEESESPELDGTDLPLRW